MVAITNRPWEQLGKGLATKEYLRSLLLPPKMIQTQKNTSSQNCIGSHDVTVCQNTDRIGVEQILSRSPLASSRDRRSLPAISTNESLLYRSSPARLFE